MGRSPARDEASAAGVKKGPWTPEEDQKLAEYVEKHGRGSWQRIPKLAGLNRCGKSCRLRWTNYLRPDIKRGKFTDEEEQLIIRLHSLLGNKWSSMATKLPGRTDNEIKNYWNTHLRKKLLRMGIDPVTHRPAPANLTLLSGLFSPGASATHLNGTLNLQADVAHLLKLQLLQSILQLLAGSSANATAAAAAAAIAVAPNANLLNLQSSIPPGSSNLSTNRFSLDEEGVSAEISSTGSFPAAAAAAAAEAEAPAPAANSCTDAAGDGWEDCDFWKDIIE